MSHPDAVWLRRYLAPLVNGVIIEVDVREDEEGAWPVIKVAIKGSDEIFELEISRDEEGNGPGFIFGLPFSEPVDPMSVVEDEPPKAS
jgi:hypothetical protein